MPGGHFTPPPVAGKRRKKTVAGRRVNRLVNSQWICQCDCAVTGAHVVGRMVTLKYPYPRDVDEPDMYVEVRVHGQCSKDVISSPHCHLAVRSSLLYIILSLSVCLCY